MDYTEEAEKEVQLKFRNYFPRDAQLRTYHIPAPNVMALEKRVVQDWQVTIENFNEQDVLSRITPRRPNADLKKELDCYLEQVRPAQERALHTLLKMKLRQGAYLTDTEPTASNDGSLPSGTTIQQSNSQDEMTTFAESNKEEGFSILQALNESEKLEWNPSDDSELESAL